MSRNVQTVASGAEQMGSSIREIAQSATEAARVAEAAAVTTDGAHDVQSAALRLSELSSTLRSLVGSFHI